MKKFLLLIGLFLSLGTVANATTIYQGCTIGSKNSPFPATPATLPLSNCSGFQSSIFGPATSGPGAGDTLNYIALLSDYRIFLQVAGASNTDFGHVVNGIGGITNFNNLVLDPVSNISDLQWGSGADISSAQGSLVNVFSCAGLNAASCTAIVAAMAANMINITTTYDNVSSNVGQVAAQYVWVIDFSATPVSEPSSLMLIAAGIAALQVYRRRLLG
jgi:hypothetical protein